MRIHTTKLLGEQVRDRRKRLGWSQSFLAEKVGVSRLWVGQFEKGKSSVELGLVLQTLRELGLSLEITLPRASPFETAPLP